MRFLFDGERMQETQTPQDLKMETGDEIDIFIEQHGGGKWSSSILGSYLKLNIKEFWYLFLDLENKVPRK